ncbi:MAG TPA: Holliday junction branch migration protein RuvA [Kiritimatiellae bacterium]|nr:Holliday junction branch migration protein RuvA [Kiritimatiellia bacterium]
MIALIEGTLLDSSPTRVILLNSGVGYEVFIPLSTYAKLPRPGQRCRLLVYDFVREDTHTLYGFWSEDEKDLFALLLSISGVGPRLALAVLSGLSPHQIREAVISGDTERLCRISGIGRKTAERIVLELKDKLGEDEMLESGGSAPAMMESDQRARDAVAALVALGYRPGEARHMISGVVGNIATDATVEDILRRALIARK